MRYRAGYRVVTEQVGREGLVQGVVREGGEVVGVTGRASQARRGGVCNYGRAESGYMWCSGVDEGSLRRLMTRMMAGMLMALRMAPMMMLGDHDDYGSDHDEHSNDDSGTDGEG